MWKTKYKKRDQKIKLLLKLLQKIKYSAKTNILKC